MLMKQRQNAALNCLTDINVKQALLGFLSRMNLMWIRYKPKSEFLLS